MLSNQKQMSDLPHTMPTPEEEVTCSGCREWGKDIERERNIELLEDELTRLNDIVDKGEYFDIPRIQFAMQILINLLNEIKGENK